MLRFPGNELPDNSQDAEARQDAHLLALMAEGDQQALAALYRRRGPVIYALLARMLGNKMEAQDVMQETFMTVWRRARNYDPVRSSPMAWMVMIVRSKAIDQLRARSRRAAGAAAYQREIVVLEVEVNTPKVPEQEELAAACALALRKLPEEQSQALQLAFFRGWTHQEIAGAIREPLGTIKARIRRGLLALRQALKDYHA